MFGPLASTTVVAKWFDRQRGRAIGIASMGPPTGGFLLSLLAGALIQAASWRVTLLVYAAAHLAIVPFIYAVVRNRPEDLGQQPDGEAVQPHPELAAAKSGPWSTGQILRTLPF